MSSDHSDALVFFGATGDLVYKQIFPALQALARRGRLEVPVIGVAKSGWTLEQLQARARESLEKHGGVDEAAFAKLLSRLRYLDADYNDATTYDRLRELLGAAAHPAFYLAIPPSLFATVATGLGKSGCARGGRVILEKPFGRDLASARALNASLRAAFDDSAVFRIDHYLGKEPVQNLGVFRFENSLLEPVWNRDHVDCVQITMAESFGVQGRGAFYDGVGAIRDVVQNHLLQVVSLLGMEPPLTNYHDAIREEQVKVLRATRPLDVADLVRGQFTGYRTEEGVAPESTVETFAALRLHIDSWRWEGVPFFIRAGKKLPVTMTEVVVRFKRPPLSRIPRGDSNYIRLRLGPEVAIGIGARVKQPGEGNASVQTELDVVHYPDGDAMTPYERLLGDAMAGDPMLFATEEGVEAAWSIVEPILGNATALREYAPGTWGPEEAEALTEPYGGWFVDG